MSCPLPLAYQVWYIGLDGDVDPKVQEGVSINGVFSKGAELVIERLGCRYHTRHLVGGGGCEIGGPERGNEWLGRNGKHT